MRKLVAGTLFVVAMAPLIASAIPPDGFYDPAWPAGIGGGYIAFDGVVESAGADSFAGVAAIQPDGSIFLAGQVSFNPSSGSWWMGELTPAGSFVPTFGLNNGTGRTNGCVMLNLCGLEQFAYDISAAPVGDGRYLVLDGDVLTRTSAQAHSYEVSVPASHITINDSQGYVHGVAAGPLPDGSAFVVGDGIYDPSQIEATPHFAVARLSPSLTPDPAYHASKDATGITFAGGGVYTLDTYSTNETASAVFIDPDGSTVLVGVTENTVAGTADLALLRLGPTGVPDVLFGSSGKLVVHQAGHTISSSYRLFPTRDRAGRVVVALVDNELSGMIVARVTPGGATDFYKVVPASVFTSAGCTSLVGRVVAIDSAGRILVGGRCFVGAVSYFAVVRLRGDTGALDTSFGFNGTSYGYFSLGSTSDYVRAMAIDSGGHPLIAGWTGAPALRRVGVARLSYDLIFTNGNESAPRGCLPPNCQ